MRHVTLVLLSAVSLTIVGCGQKSSETNAAGADTAGREATGGGMDDGLIGNDAASASPAQTFANTAAASDAFEIATSQLAQSSAKSAAVKSFASKMIEGHGASTAKLKTAASAASPAITPDPALSPDQQQRLDALKAKSGAEFDRAYAAEQVAAHEATLAALKDYSAKGDVPQLKAFATGMIPTVSAHLNLAKGLK